MAKVKITETVLRDSHQSLVATRMTTEEMLPILESLDKGIYLSAAEPVHYLCGDKSAASGYAERCETAHDDDYRLQAQEVACGRSRTDRYSEEYSYYIHKLVLRRL